MSGIELLFLVELHVDYLVLLFGRCLGGKYLFSFNSRFSQLVSVRYSCN